jgi:hypothetical protein
MEPVFENMAVRAPCPDCGGAITSFEHRDANHEFGLVSRTVGAIRAVYLLLRCASCGRGGLAEVRCGSHVSSGILMNFYPYSVDAAKLPEDVPEEIVQEFREAENCAAIRANRAASALLRSALEKALNASGYRKGRLIEKIDAAAADGVITEPRRIRAHGEVRVLGNDVLHDDWRTVSAEEINASRLYTQRVLEDLFDNRPSVEETLRNKGRIA